MRKIYITEKQLKEAFGAPLSYFNANDNGARVNPFDSEITTDGQINGETENTTDKIASKRTPRTYFGAQKRHSTINCEKNSDNNLIKESNKDLEDNIYTIPNEIFKLLSYNYNTVKNKNNVKSIKRLKNLLNDRGIKNSEMYRLKNFFDNTDEKNEEFKLLGGTKMKRWIEQQLKSATTASKHSKDVRHNMGDKNAYIKNHIKNSGNGMAHTEKKDSVEFHYE